MKRFNISQHCNTELMTISIDTYKHPVIYIVMYNTIMYNTVMYNTIMYNTVSESCKRTTVSYCIQLVNDKHFNKKILKLKIVYKIYSTTYIHAILFLFHQVHCLIGTVHQFKHHVSP